LMDVLRPSLPRADRQAQSHQLKLGHLYLKLPPIVL